MIILNPFNLVNNCECEIHILLKKACGLTLDAHIFYDLGHVRGDSCSLFLEFLYELRVP
jgi:hypothetical protein